MASVRLQPPTRQIPPPFYDTNSYTIFVDYTYYSYVSYAPFSSSRQFGSPKPCVLVVYVLVARKYREFKKKRSKSDELRLVTQENKIENRICSMAFARKSVEPMY